MLLALSSILAALATARQDESGRARTQQLQGRLGIRKKKTPPDLQKRIRWAWQTHPQSRLGLLLLYSRPWGIVGRHSPWYTFDNTARGRRDPADTSLPLDWPLTTERRFGPLHPTDLRAQPRMYTQLWPVPGRRVPDMEQLTPWLARVLSVDLDTLYTDLRDEAHARSLEEFLLEIADHDVDRLNEEGVGDDYIRSPWDYMQESDLPSYYLDGWVDSHGFEDLQDPWLRELRTKTDEDGNLEEKLHFNHELSGDIEVDDLPIANAEISWVEGQVHDEVRRPFGKPDPTGAPNIVRRHRDEELARRIEILPLRLKVTHPRRPDLWMLFENVDDPGSTVHKMRAERWRWIDYGPGLEAIRQKALAELASEDGTEAWRVWDFIEDLPTRADLKRVQYRLTNTSGLIPHLPDLADFVPPEGALEGGWSDLDIEEVREQIKLGNDNYTSRRVKWTPDALSAIWDLVYLTESASAWAYRLAQLYDELLPPALQLIRDELGATGQLPRFEDYWGSSLGRAAQKARIGHNDRANDRWWEDWRAQNKPQARALELHGGDRTVASWPDGGRVVELTEDASLRREGDAMSHCVGSHAQYVTRSERRVFSYRDADNRPWATFEVRDIDGFPGTDFQGYNNRAIPTQDEEGQSIPAHERSLAFLAWLRRKDEDGSDPPSRWLNQQERSRIDDAGDLDQLLSSGLDDMQIASTTSRKASNVQPQRNSGGGREYDNDEWLAFLVEIEDDEGVITFDSLAEDDQEELERLRVAFEERVEELMEIHFPDEEFTWQEAYLTYGSLVGHGIGLWEERQPWHPEFEPIVRADERLGQIQQDIETTYLGAWPDRGEEE